MNWSNDFVLYVIIFPLFIQKSKNYTIKDQLSLSTVLEPWQHQRGRLIFSFSFVPSSKHVNTYYAKNETGNW